MLALPALAQEEGCDRAENWTFEGEPITEESLQQMREYGLNIAFLDVHDCSEVMASGNQDDTSACLDAQEFLLTTNEKFACFLAAVDGTIIHHEAMKKHKTDACIESLQERLDLVQSLTVGDYLARRYSAFFNMTEAQQMMKESLNRMKVYRNYLTMKMLRD